MPLDEYVAAVFLLVGTVMTIQLVGAARSRRYAIASLAGFGVLVTAAYFAPTIVLESLAGDDRDRLFVTLAIWGGSALVVDLTPVADEMPGLGERP